MKIVNPYIPNIPMVGWKLGLGALSYTEAAIYWTALLTPLWWLLGVQVFLYPAVVVTLLGAGLSVDKLAKTPLPLSTWAWFAMSLAMLMTTVLAFDRANLVQVATLTVALLKGYFLIFASLALPFFQPLRSAVITRAVAWMTASYTPFLAITTALWLFNIQGDGKPLLASILPGDSAFALNLVGGEKFLGLTMPRISGYTPDPPILGTCAVLCFFICLGESNRWLRYSALLGSILGLIFSFGRTAWLAFPIAIVVYLLFRLAIIPQMVLGAAAVASFIGGLFWMRLEELFQGGTAQFNQARESGTSSSITRSKVVNRTLELWQESPWTGWGFIQHQVHLYEKAYMPATTFSTYAAVLYLHGVVGFVVFLLAMLATLWDVFEPSLRGDALAARACGSLIALYLMLGTTTLSWMAPFLWFFFVWLGTVIREATLPPLQEAVI
jgi:O-antigen ligase